MIGKARINFLSLATCIISFIASVLAFKAADVDDHYTHYISQVDPSMGTYVNKPPVIACAIFGVSLLFNSLLHGYLTVKDHHTVAILVIKGILIALMFALVVAAGVTTDQAGSLDESPYYEAASIAMACIALLLSITAIILPYIEEKHGADAGHSNQSDDIESSKTVAWPTSGQVPITTYNHSHMQHQILMPQVPVLKPQPVIHSFTSPNPLLVAAAGYHAGS